MNGRFARLATVVSDTLGHASVFIAAVAIVIVWAMTGPLFGFSPAWQLVINTGTTIITFHMVLMIRTEEARIPG